MHFNAQAFSVLDPVALLAALAEVGDEVTVEKVSHDAEITGYGIASTPSLVVDGNVMHAGGLPKAEDIARWITA